MAFDALPTPDQRGPDPEPPGVRELAPFSAAPARRPIALIAGAGPAGIEAALALRAYGGARLRVELLAPRPVYVHRPLSVLEPFAAGHARAHGLDDLAALGIRIHEDALAGVDVRRRRVRTEAGRALPYDFLLIATGAGTRAALPHAVTFGGPRDVEALHGVIQDLEGGWSRRIAFVAPPGASWTLPIYELAVQAARRAYEANIAAEITLVTHERAPLEVFGPSGSECAERLLREAGIALVTGAQPAVPRAGRVLPHPDAPPLEVDRIVTLPVHEGRPIPGLPADGNGLLAVDAHGRVRGVDRVYAAGDATDAPVKQGGLATQQAEAAAEAIAFDAGMRDAAAPFTGVLRATLVGGDRPVYLRRRLDEPDGQVALRSPWWPPGKIVGRRLAPYLDARASDESGETVERALERRAAPARRVAAIGRGPSGAIEATPLESRS